MHSDKNDFASPEALEHALQQLVPDLDIKIRAEFTDGLSKATVYLVSCQIDEENRFGALKLVSPEKADQELHGYQQASASWLKPFLPDHCNKICTLTDGTVALLSSLAGRWAGTCLRVRVLPFHVLVRITYFVAAGLVTGWVSVRRGPT